MATSYIVVFVTVPTQAIARTMARFLVAKKLAACVNIIPAVESYFWWENKVDKAKERLLVMKTKRRLFTRLAQAVQSKHPYIVPEIIALPIVSGNKAYMDWINESCR